MILGTEIGLKNAIAAHEAAIDKLYRRDGQPMYGDAEMKERKAEADAVLVEKTETIAAEAQQEMEKAAAELSFLDVQSPVEWMNDSELQAANLRRQWVFDDVAMLDTETLRTRLQAAVNAGNRVNTFLLTRAIESRITQEMTKQPKQRGDIISLTQDIEAARSLLAPADIASKRDKLTETRQRAQAAMIEANKRRLKAQGAERRFQIRGF